MLYAEILGLRLDGRSRFRVIDACSRSQSQRCIGKRVSVLHNPATKRLLLPGSYGTFCRIASVHMRWYQLEFDLLAVVELF
jgi:hypothetical protein